MKGLLIFIEMGQVTLSRWPPYSYLVKTLKIFFSRARSSMKLGIQHRTIKVYKVYINDDPVMTFTYFTTRSNLAAFAFLAFSFSGVVCFVLL